ncbi:hypothetical protein WMF18_26710 [Sorangium sp. So ce315]|uniref:hypothetical protein n=1 Tax=Sorangium sp. So ce315 TaxID=3133299 RepID=UPI003F61BFE5
MRRRRRAERAQADAQLADAGRVWTEADRQTFRSHHAAPGGLLWLAELLLGLIVERTRTMFGPALQQRLAARSSGGRRGRPSGGRCGRRAR